MLNTKKYFIKITFCVRFSRNNNSHNFVKITKKKKISTIIRERLNETFLPG